MRAREKEIDRDTYTLLAGLINTRMIHYLQNELLTELSTSHGVSVTDTP